jgi:hypothetical protein
VQLVALLFIIGLWQKALRWRTESVKNALLGFSLSLLLSCASAPFPRADAAPRGLDEALSLGVDYLADKLPPRAKVAVVSARPPAENLSNYLIDTAVMRLVNKDRFTVIERAELDALQKEQAYQASGKWATKGRFPSATNWARRSSSPARSWKPAAGIPCG